MRLFQCVKDGGRKSTVWAYFLLEWKGLFSVALLHFHPGSRDAYHNHAFNSWSWVIWGRLTEYLMSNYKMAEDVNEYRPSLLPIITKRSTFHRVVSHGHTWAITVRGPWSKEWMEYIPTEDKFQTLTYGRKVVA